MKFTLPVHQTDMTRQEQLDLWIRRQKTSYAALGRFMGLSRSGARFLFRADRAPVERVDQMRAIQVDGKTIPDSLLPKPCNVKRGPKPLADNS